jgi:hypothetical protein
MTFDKIAFQPTQPGRIDILWAKPVRGGFALYLHYNGKWQPLKVMKEDGADTPDDDKPYDFDAIGATKLSELEDVSLNTLTEGQILKYKGSSWENDDDTGGTPGPDSVGTEQIIDGAVEMQDLHDDVKGKIQKTYDISDESLSMDFDIQP